MTEVAAALDASHPRHLAHHFDRPQQQYEAAKLGMWLFLATEILMFGGLFCAYAVYRNLHPELFDFGSRYLDATWGAINTVVLILSSVTMALAVWCAQIGRRAGLIFFLGLTLLFAVDFMVIKAIEYSHKFHENLTWGLTFYDGDLSDSPATESVTEALDPAIAEARAAEIWQQTCRTCHGANGEGVPNQGKELRGSQFVADRDDQEIVRFLKKGRLAGDPENTTGIMMPPRGGNPLLTDSDLGALVPRLRKLAAEPASAPSEPGAAAIVTTAMVPTSVIPLPATGPSGMILDLGVDADERQFAAPNVPNRPDNPHIFFGIYFCMTGLHGLHVLGGIALISILMVMSFKGRFGREYYTPVELGGLYWHIVDIIWIFLFPLLYLIG